uniref:Uncharacterized protein n=1 Tax=Cacopsylla melanoneura TaxID=428564 RepID=A0A8D8TF59_9HEMI
MNILYQGFLIYPGKFFCLYSSNSRLDPIFSIFVSSSFFFMRMKPSLIHTYLIFFSLANAFTSPSSRLVVTVICSCMNISVVGNLVLTLLAVKFPFSFRCFLYCVIHLLRWNLEPR